MRKSEPLNYTPKGNAAKFFSYREAWTRIKIAQEQGFYIEAVAIQESIISDRLISYFTAKDIVIQQKYPSFKNLIDTWKKQSVIAYKNIENLQESVDSWRIKRNEVTHGIVKPQSEELTVVDVFLMDAQDVAAEGTTLANAVCAWRSKMKAKKYL